MITNNLRDIRRNLAYRHSLIIVYIEIGASHVQADSIATLIEKAEFQPLIVESRDSKGLARPGVVTGAEQKRVGTLHLSRELERKTLRIAAELITQDKKKSIIELSNQMRSWRKEIVMPHDQAVGTFKEVFTGKASGGGKKDDRIMALILALYWSAFNHADPVFRVEMARRGRTI
jgi:hypothetical protein